jgi:proteasome beta subunit
MTTIVGIKTKEGVVLGSDKRASKGFFIGSKITQKIAKIDDTLAVAIAGQLSDEEYLIKVAKAERKLMELRRGFPLTVKESARLIANLAYSGMKNYQPYFVELLVAGIDQDGGHVYAADKRGLCVFRLWLSRRIRRAREHVPQRDHERGGEAGCRQGSRGSDGA